METEKMIENAKHAIDGINVSSENLILAIVKLLELAHIKGLDADAKKILADCGIMLETTEE